MGNTFAEHTDMPATNPYIQSSQGNQPDFSAIVNKAIPGFNGLTNSATGIIDNLLKGLPSSSSARASNAYFGAGSGLGAGSDFLRNRGFDLYGQQGEQRKQTGLQDLLSFLQGYSGTVMPTTGQTLQDRQASNQLGFQQQQYYDSRYDQEQAEAEARRAQGAQNWIRNAAVDAPSVFPGSSGWRTGKSIRESNPSAVPYFLETGRVSQGNVVPKWKF